jgi:hypothetical protein
MAKMTIERKDGAAMGMRFKRGTAVVMDDGWHGKIESVDGDTVICIQDGERPNDWLRGYRAVKRWRMTINGSKATVNWKSSTVGRVQRSPGSSVVDFERSRSAREDKKRQDFLLSEWDAAPAY